MKQEQTPTYGGFIPRLIMAVLFLAFLTSCRTFEEKKKSIRLEEASPKSTEASMGYSPPPRKKNLDIKRDTTRYSVEKTRPLPRRLVSLKMGDADLPTVLRSLARSVDVNILVSEKVTGKINVAVDQVPWDEVFKNILKTHGLSYVYDSRIIRVMTDEDLVAELNREKLKQSLEKMEPLMTRIIKIDYADSKHLKESLLVFLDRKAPASSGQQADKAPVEPETSTITVDSHTNSLVIRATRQEMAKILPVIEALDRPTPQVLIKAWIVETNQSTARELGAKWNRGYGDFTAGVDLSVTDGAFLGFSSTHNGNILSLELSALESEGKLRILSNPSITTVDNRKAMIESGKEIPYQSIEDGEISVEYKKAVIHLDVTPHVIDRELIRLSISTSKDEIDNSVVVNGNPGIITKKAETEVVLYNGSTTVIGGLNKDKSERNIKGIPYLMDIPLLGHLFKWDSDSQEMEELLIFISPVVLGERTAEEAKVQGKTSTGGDSDEKKTR